MLKIIKDYKANEHAIKRIKKNRDKIFEEGKEKRYSIQDDYRKKIRTLENEKDAHVEKIDNRLSAIRRAAQAGIDEHYKAIHKVERIAYFLSVDLNQDLTIKNNEIKAYRDRHIESMGYIFDDLLLKIKVFIVENGKPKNKWSLVAFGKSIFNEPAIKFPYFYGMPTNESTGFCLKAEIKCFTTMENAQAWLRKNSDRLFKANIEEYRAIKKEHKEVLNTYAIADLEPVISHQCKKCGKFLIGEQAACIVLRDNKCPKCDAPGFAKKR